MLFGFCFLDFSFWILPDGAGILQSPLGVTGTPITVFYLHVCPTPEARSENQVRTYSTEAPLILTTKSGVVLLPT